MSIPPLVWIKRCPVGCMANSQRHKEDKNVYLKCKITTHATRCRNCGTNTIGHSKECSLRWYVCEACHPAHCGLYSQPENESPTVGVIKYV